MPSKQLLAVMVAASFAIGLQFTPMPERWRLPVVIAAWLFFAFAGGAWVNEHRNTRKLPPVDKREKLDRLVLQGERLKDKWVADKRPRIRTWIWHSEAKRFVKAHFSMTIYDQFIGYMAAPGSLFALALKHPKETFPDFDRVIELMGRVEGLKLRVRREIRDGRPPQT